MGAEKPNPAIFLAACELLKVKPEEVVHVGDDRRNDVWGARDAGCDAWLWGEDVNSFLVLGLISHFGLYKDINISFSFLFLRPGHFPLRS